MTSAAPWNDEGFTAIENRLDELALRLGRSGRRSAGTSPGQSSAERAADIGSSLRALESRFAAVAEDLSRLGNETPRRLADAIGQLNARLDQLITGGRIASGEFERRVASVHQALGALNRESTLPAGSGEWRTADRDAAEIAARQRKLDANSNDLDRPREAERAPAPGTNPSASDLSGLDQRLRELVDHVENLRPCGFDDSVAELRRELAEISRVLAAAMPRSAVEAIESEVRSLANRVDRGRDRIDAAALAGLERSLTRLCDALGALAPAESLAGIEEHVKTLARKIDAVASAGPDATAIGHLEMAIAELRGISERVASGNALGALATEVRMLAEKIDRFVAPAAGEAGEALDRRFEALSAALTARATETGQTATAHLETLVRALSDKIDRTQSSHSDRLESQLIRLAEKIDASDARLGNLEMVERGFADLFLQLEEMRAGTIEAAEHAAKAVLRDFPNAAASDSAVVDILQRDVAELRDTQSAIERRTQDTLETVHGMVERLVDRLAMVESDIREAPRRAAARAPESDILARTAVQPPPRPLPAMSPAPASSAPAPSEPPPQLPAVRERPIDSDLPPDFPLEPGSGVPRGRAATPAERIAASEAALGPAKPSSAPVPSEKANFIAAARRAAQAAAADAASSSRVDDKTESSPDGDKLGKRRRPLLMSIAAAILVVGALHLTTNVFVSADRPRAAAPLPVKDRTAAAPPPAVAPAANAADPAATLADPVVPPIASAPSPTVLAGPPTNSPGIPDPRLVPAANPFGITAMNYPPADTTGAIPNRPAATAPASAPAATPAAAPAAAPVGDLPASIGGAALRAAANAGDPAAEYEVAVRYAEGRGVPQDLGQAAHWFERAAKHGLVPAQYRLAGLYEKGQGVKKDLEAARRLYLAAADKGHGKAMHNLAVLYAEGIDGKPDYRTAFQWFRKAAERGIADSQYNLGILYARGIGTDQNLAESYKWFALAAGQGDQDAARKRDDVANRLDAQSLVAAKLAAQTFTADPQPDEATTVRTPPGGWDRAATAVAPTKTKTPAHKKGAS